MAENENKSKSREKKKGLYVFKHPNKYLTVAMLGVQFRDGKYETESRELAEALINIEDIELVSQP